MFNIMTITCTICKSRFEYSKGYFNPLTEVCAEWTTEECARFINLNPVFAFQNDFLDRICCNRQNMSNKVEEDDDPESMPNVCYSFLQNSPQLLCIVSALLRLTLVRLIDLHASSSTLVPTIALSLRFGHKRGDREYDPDVENLVVITIVPFAQTVIGYLKRVDQNSRQIQAILTLLGELLVQTIGPTCFTEFEQKYLTPENQILLQKLNHHFLKLQSHRSFDPRNLTAESSTQHFALARWTSPPLLKDLVSLCADINNTERAASSSVGILKLYERVSRAVPEKMYPANSLAYDDPVLSSIHMQLPLALLTADGLLHHFEAIQNAAWRCHPFYSDELQPPPQCASTIALEDRILEDIIKISDPIFSTVPAHHHADANKTENAANLNWLLEESDRGTQRIDIDAASKQFPFLPITDFTHEAQLEGSLTAPDAISSISLPAEPEGDFSGRQESQQQ